MGELPGKQKEVNAVLGRRIRETVGISICLQSLEDYGENSPISPVQANEEGRDLEQQEGISLKQTA